LIADPWTRMGAPVAGTGDLVTFTSIIDPNTSNQRFFRLNLLP